MEWMRPNRKIHVKGQLAWHNKHQTKFNVDTVIDPITWSQIDESLLGNQYKVINTKKVCRCFSSWVGVTEGGNILLKSCKRPRTLPKYLTIKKSRMMIVKDFGKRCKDIEYHCYITTTPVPKPQNMYHLDQRGQSFSSMEVIVYVRWST